MPEIKVSIIVPFYNVELYLRDCLQSLALQTLKEIEIIMINDGSKDASPQIALEYEKLYSNFYLVNQENRGLSASRNIGIERARGKYISFCDSDDIMRSDAMEVLYTEAEKSQVDVLHFEAVRFKHGESVDVDRKEQEDINACRIKGYYNTIFSGKECLNRMLQTDVLSASQLMFINRNFLVQSGVKFYEGIIHEDFLFQFQLYIETKKMKNIPDCLYFSRLREGSIMTGSNWKERYRGYARCFLEMCKEFKSNENFRQYAYIERYPIVAFNCAIDCWRNMLGEQRSEPVDNDIYRMMSKAVRTFKGSKTLRMWIVGWMPQILFLYYRYKKNGE